ncbi:hypothetical protein EQZ23_15710 [Sphingomonas sp. UV9]|uniref:hypothetical protein n=1 Tax=Sphingomonas sp. UV9 TaxID=1851410 RepID=UPI000FFB377F|nr:hypothetical protein [Sphingomonas sp. UV9]RXD03755.1 hypothetical protein EQZ23_15710 [Sphingomonas sp. UV9]
MNTIEIARETRKQRRLEILGTNDPRCAKCGDDRWQCLELHHVADHGQDEATVCICRNCHRVLSDLQKDHPPVDPKADPLLSTIGHFLLGLVDMLRIIVEKLQEFGLALIARASVVEGGPK